MLERDNRQVPRDRPEVDLSSRKRGASEVSVASVFLAVETGESQGVSQGREPYSFSGGGERAH